MKPFSLPRLYQIQTNDLILQMVALVIPAIIVLFTGATAFLLEYATVGAVQISSCILYFFRMPKAARDKGRRVIELVLVIAFGLGLVLLLIPAGDLRVEAGMCYLIAVAFCSPFIAAWYMIIVYRERNTVREAIWRKDLDEIASDVL